MTDLSHCVPFPGKYSRLRCEQYSARLGATSCHFHYAVTADAVYPIRPRDVGSVVGTRRYRGLVVATFDNTTPADAMQRIQQYEQQKET